MSTLTKSPLSPLIRFFFYQNGLKHRTLGIFSFLPEAFLFNLTVGSPGLKPHTEVGAKPRAPREEGLPILSCCHSPSPSPGPGLLLPWASAPHPSNGEGWGWLLAQAGGEHLIKPGAPTKPRDVLRALPPGAQRPFLQGSRRLPWPFRRLVSNPGSCPPPSTQHPCSRVPCGGTSKDELSRIICSSSRETGSGRDHPLGSSNVFSHLAVEYCPPGSPTPDLTVKPRIQGAFKRTAPPRLMCVAGPKHLRTTDPTCLLSSPGTKEETEASPGRVTVVCGFRGGRGPALGLTEPENP